MQVCELGAPFMASPMTGPAALFDGTQMINSYRGYEEYVPTTWAVHRPLPDNTFFFFRDPLTLDDASDYAYAPSTPRAGDDGS